MGEVQRKASRGFARGEYNNEILGTRARARE